MSEAGPCSVCGKTCSKRCSGCKLVLFCSAACQAKGWPDHKAACLKARKAAKAKAKAAKAAKKAETIKKRMEADLAAPITDESFARLSKAGKVPKTFPGIEKYLFADLTKGKKVIADPGNSTYCCSRMEQRFAMEREKGVALPPFPQTEAVTDWIIHFLGDDKRQVMALTKRLLVNTKGTNKDIVIPTRLFADLLRDIAKYPGAESADPVQWWMSDGKGKPSKA